MEQPGRGQVVTFYSFQGGTGRSMALANVALILAMNGKRVLIVDWDLEAPGLHRFLEPFLDADYVVRQAGVIDLLREYEDEVVHGAESIAEKIRRVAAVERHTIGVSWAFPGTGRLSLLTAGRQNSSYSPALGERDWDRFFEDLHGVDFLEALRDDMRASYEYTLIDSRAGLSDVVDICTQHLPDVLVDCYSLSNQAIDGAVRTAYAVARYARRGEPTRRIKILPVAMRVDHTVPSRADSGRRVAELAFSGLPHGVLDTEQIRYPASVEIPYRAEYAFEETLAVFGDAPGDPESLLASYERLTEVITDGEVRSCPPLNSDERLRVLRRCARTPR